MDSNTVRQPSTLSFASSWKVKIIQKRYSCWIMASTSVGIHRFKQYLWMGGSDLRRYLSFYHAVKLKGERLRVSVRIWLFKKTYNRVLHAKMCFIGIRAIIRLVWYYQTLRYGIFWSPCWRLQNVSSQNMVVFTNGAHKENTEADY